LFSQQLSGQQHAGFDCPKLRCRELAFSVLDCVAYRQRILNDAIGLPLPVRLGLSYWLAWRESLIGSNSRSRKITNHREADGGKKDCRYKLASTVHQHLMNRWGFRVYDAFDSGRAADFEASPLD
jgi:hypothetical protein